MIRGLFRVALNGLSFVRSARWVQCQERVRWGSAMRGLMIATAALGGVSVGALSQGKAASASSSGVADRSFTVAGTDWPGPRDVRGLATGTQLEITALAATAHGGFLLADSNRVWRVRQNGRITVVAGNGKSGFSGDGGRATAARLNYVLGLAAMPDGGFLIADALADRVRRVWPDGHISTVAGGGSSPSWGDGGPATAAEVVPEGVAAMPDGGFLIAEPANCRVRRVWADGHISTVAGGAGCGFSGDGGPATAAQLDEPKGVAALTDGGFLIADTMNSRVRRVWPDGHISTVAGGGATGGDRGPATAASLGDVEAVATLPEGGFVFAEYAGYDDVRRVWPDGDISTVTGGADWKPEYFGDGGPAAAARFTRSERGSVAVLSDGGIVNSVGHEVRLAVGPHGTGLLVAGIRPLDGVALKRGYRLRLVLNKPARVTVRLYGSPNGRPVATSSTSRRAGGSTVTVAARHAVPAGLYAVDVLARAGSQTTRALTWVYLGGKLTEPFVDALQTKTEPGTPAFDSASQHAIPAEPTPPTGIVGCRQFTATRIDCEWTSYGYGNWVDASFITAQGQIYTRKYRGHIRLRPRWVRGQSWEEIDVLWGVRTPARAPTSGRG